LFASNDSDQPEQIKRTEMEHEEQGNAIGDGEVLTAVEKYLHHLNGSLKVDGTEKETGN